MLDKSVDAKQLILWVESSESPPKIYHLDINHARAALIEDTMPWLASTALAPSKVVTAKSKDGLPIEAYLTLPAGSGKRPLIIVMPHGGPIGVSDTLRFDRDTQFLASLGYAVLRVNYRGSEGFGKAFRKAGKGRLGTAIEDDVDAALNAALASFTSQFNAHVRARFQLWRLLGLDIRSAMAQAFPLCRVGLRNH